MRSRLAVVVAGAALLAAPAASHASTRHAGGHQARGTTHVLKVVWTYRESAGHYDGASCRGLGETPPSVTPDTCREYYTGDAQMRGAVVGTQHFYLDTWWTADGHMHYEGTPVITASIAGCGTGVGTFGFRETNGDIDYPHADPSTFDARGTNDWEIVPGSATGGLAGHLIGGHGVNVWFEHMTHGAADDGSDSGDGTYTGTLTCRS